MSVGSSGGSLVDSFVITSRHYVVMGLSLGALSGALSLVLRELFGAILEVRRIDPEPSPSRRSITLVVLG